MAATELYQRLIEATGKNFFKYSQLLIEEAAGSNDQFNMTVHEWRDARLKALSEAAGIAGQLSEAYITGAVEFLPGGVVVVATHHVSTGELDKALGCAAPAALPIAFRYIGRVIIGNAGRRILRGLLGKRDDSPLFFWLGKKGTRQAPKEIGALAPAEKLFVQELLKKKPGYIVYRVKQGAGLGDLVVIDPSNPGNPLVFAIELKTASNSAEAGLQLISFKDLLKAMGFQPDRIHSFTGTLDEFLALIGA